MWMTWLIICGVSLMLEIFTVSFLIFWAGIAAFIVFLLSFTGISTAIQIAIFCILSAVLMIFTKPLTEKYFKVKDANLNARSIINKDGIVLKSINNLTNEGQVKISGEVWSAISEDNSIIPVDSVITVVSIQGVKLKVKLKEEK